MKRVNIKYLVISVILILVLSLSGGCLQPSTDTSLLPNSSPTNTASSIDPNWTPPTAESNAPVLPSIADVVAKVRPSVVAINTKAITYDFFNQPSTQEGAGSGWIINENGIIVTNSHVVEGAENVTVTLSDDRVFTAEIIRTDPRDDLAVIEINAVKTRSSLRVTVTLSAPSTTWLLVTIIPLSSIIHPEPAPFWVNGRLRKS